MNTTLHEFNAYVAALATHDWHYDYADDRRAYRKGYEANKQLMSQANTNPVLQEAYSTYSTSVMSSTGSLLQRIERREAVIDKLRNGVRQSQLVPA